MSTYLNINGENVLLAANRVLQPIFSNHLINLIYLGLIRWCMLSYDKPFKGTFTQAVLLFVPKRKWSVPPIWRNIFSSKPFFFLQNTWHGKIYNAIN
jgi:hypothetical protein